MWVFAIFRVKCREPHGAKIRRRQSVRRNAARASAKDGLDWIGTKASKAKTFSFPE